VPRACFIPLRRRDDARDAGALLIDGLEADLAGCSFQRLDMEGNRRLIRDANESLLRSLGLYWLRGGCAKISKSSPGDHSGLGDTTLERDTRPAWCAQKGVSPWRFRSVQEGMKAGRTTRHTYTQGIIVILVLGVLAFPGDIEGTVVSLFWILRKVMQRRFGQIDWRFWRRSERRIRILPQLAAIGKSGSQRR
jgi:hypothetical protein